MPLIKLTGDKEKDYFVDGLTEELSFELARYQDFQVIASQSTLRFKGQKVNFDGVGRDPSVQFVLTGSIRKDLKTFKISIRLLNTSIRGANLGGEL